MEEANGRWKVPAKRISGEEYLTMWKIEGGSDIVNSPQVSTKAEQKKSVPEVWEEPAAKTKR
jgi:large subunit ribosomal protein L41